MKPVFALVGRPNVGKSTLFNRLTRSRDALVADYPGLTRDRKYGDGKVGDRAYVVVDTGGIGEGEDGIQSAMGDQARSAIAEADVVLFMVDGRAGLTVADEHIANHLRTLNKPIVLVVNKTDGVDAHVASSDFFSLGIAEQFSIAASQGRNVTQMMGELLERFPDAPLPEELDSESGIRVAIVGRPNVGKSTLVNRMLGEDRVVVYDMAGTTRDSIYIPFERRDQKYTLIDTAGVRRRGKVNEAIEKFSVIKAMQAIDDAHVVLLVIDAKEGITDQDLSLLGHILQAGRSLVVVVNKWDGLDNHHREQVKEELARRLEFAQWARIHYISALHGTGVGEIYALIQRAWESAFTRMSTNRLTQLLEDMTREQAPTGSGRHRPKLRYAHIGGMNPPRIIIHGSNTDGIPDSYRRYLENRYRQVLKLEGTPVKVEFRTGENPYEGRRNTLTPRQVERKKRLMKFVKKGR